MTHDDRYMLTVSDDFCVILWKVIDRDGRGKKIDRELPYSQEILIPTADLHEKASRFVPLLLGDRIKCTDGRTDGVQHLMLSPRKGHIMNEQYDRSL